jgi:hypothetical protein
MASIVGGRRAHRSGDTRGPVSKCGGRSAPVLISDLDHRAVADDHRDVAVPHREVAGHWPGDHTGVGSPTRCAPLVQVWALCPEGGVVTVSGLDNGSSPNQVKTLLPATHPHHGASWV